MNTVSPFARAPLWQRPGSAYGPGMTSQPITLFIGGARSGKSRAAEALVTAGPPPWVYIATAEAFDDEMRERIATHRAARAPGWRTVEAPLQLPDMLAREAATGQPVLIDCLTLWLSNLMLAARDVEAETARLLEALKAAQARAPITLVSNEVGMGIIPDNKLSRDFRDNQGRLNQAVAALASRVIFMAAGLPLILKGTPL